jgi:hypothetical protein
MSSLQTPNRTARRAKGSCPVCRKYHGRDGKALEDTMRRCCECDRLFCFKTNSPEFDFCGKFKTEWAVDGNGRGEECGGWFCLLCRLKYYEDETRRCPEDSEIPVVKVESLKILISKKRTDIKKRKLDVVVAGDDRLDSKRKKPNGRSKKPRDEASGWKPEISVEEFFRKYPDTRINELL